METIEKEDTNYNIPYVDVPIIKYNEVNSDNEKESNNCISMCDECECECDSEGDY